MSERSREQGYVLLGVTVLLVILGIFMWAAVPVWQHVMQREREKELIWRGMQYVQAVERYQRKYPGAFPPNLEVLVKEKFLRKIYDDPMSEDGKWRLIRQLSQEVSAVPGAPPPQGQEGARPGMQGADPSDPASPFGPSGFNQPRTSPFASQPGSLGAGAGEGLGGIVGVASTSKEKSIMIYEGKDRYDQWLFVYAPQMAQPGAPNAPVPGAPPAPGAGPGPVNPPANPFAQPPQPPR